MHMLRYVGRHSSTTALAGASMGSLAFNIAGNMVVAAPLAAMDTVAPWKYFLDRTTTSQGIVMSVDRHSPRFAGITQRWEKGEIKVKLHFKEKVEKR